MSQHDYSLANQSRTSFRSDLNDALAAIVSQNSGASAPSTTFAYQFWADTTTGILKQRNAANSAWINLWTIANGPLDKATANTVLAALNLAKGANIASAATTNIWATDGNLVHVTGTTGITSLGTAAQAGATRTVIFDGAVLLTHNATTLVLPGGSNYTTTAGEVIEFVADTTTKIVMKSASAAVSDTKIAFNAHRNSVDQSIPSGVDTQIELTHEDYDIGSCFSSYIFTPTVEDVYHATFNAMFNTSGIPAGVLVIAYIRKNGLTLFPYAQQYLFTDGGSRLTLQVSKDVYLNGTTDYIDFQVKHLHSSAIPCLGSSAVTFATAHRTHAY